MSVWVHLWDSTTRQCWGRVRVRGRGPGAGTSRGNGSLGQAQFGEASGEAEELLAQAEETWGVERERGPLRDGQWGQVVQSQTGRLSGVWAWGQGWHIGAGAGIRSESPCSDRVGLWAGIGVCVVMGGRIQGWGSPLSSMGLWDRVRACSTQLPFSPNTPASFWTKSLQGRGGRMCLSQALGFPSSSTCLPGWGCNVWRPLQVGSSSGPARELAVTPEYLGSCAETKPSLGSSRLEQRTLLGG